MRKFLLFLFILGFVKGNAQKTTDFPESWLGIWKGKMEIITPKGVKQSLTMELHITEREKQKEDTARVWNWTIVYRINKDSADIRNYTLIEKDKEKGHYLMDEQNDILLDCYYIGGVFWSAFEVQDTKLLSIDRKEGKTLISEIMYGPAEPVQTTGGTSEEIPPVKSYGIKGVQRAVMRKTAR